jgi:hypothetical protein
MGWFAGSLCCISDGWFTGSLCHVSVSWLTESLCHFSDGLVCRITVSCQWWLIRRITVSCECWLVNRITVTSLMSWLTGSLCHVSDGWFAGSLCHVSVGWLTGSLCHFSDGWFAGSLCHVSDRLVHTSLPCAFVIDTVSLFPLQGQLKRRFQFILEEIMLQYAYPRLDINVTKGLNHLLKSPFCIHPKTGKVCLPFHPRAAEKFDPCSVPTIRWVICYHKDAFTLAVSKINANSKLHVFGQIINVPVGSFLIPCGHGVSRIKYFGYENECYNLP